jgi:hypothetical protein
MPYASETDVPVERSKAGIEELCKQYGATGYQSGWGDGWEAIAFQIKAGEEGALRFVKLKLPIRPRRKDENERQYAQYRRSAWRALYLTIKAKFVAVEAGISSIEREFLADVVMPDGSTIYEFLQPQIEAGYKSGRMPAGLLASGTPVRPQGTLLQQRGR